MTFNNTFLTKSLNVLGNRRFFLNVGENGGRRGREGRVGGIFLWGETLRRERERRRNNSVGAGKSEKHSAARLMVLLLLVVGRQRVSQWTSLSSTRFFPSARCAFPTSLPTRERRADALQTAVHPAGTHAAAPRPETSQGFWLLFRLCPPLICLNLLLNKAL